MVRAGYPPIILRRKDRDRYLEALARADESDIGAFLEIVAGRLEDALRDLERAAERRQGYDLLRQRSHLNQSNRLAVWNAGVHLLSTSVMAHLTNLFADSNIEVEMKEFDQLKVDDFIEPCEGRPVRLCWAFQIRLRAPGMPVVERLAWASVPGKTIASRLSREPGRPVLKWSVPNLERYPRWAAAGTASPGGEEMTIHQDRWLLLCGEQITDVSPSNLAGRFAEEIAELTVPGANL